MDTDSSSSSTTVPNSDNSLVASGYNTTTGSEGIVVEDEDMELGSIVNQFLNLSTTDKDVLISQLQKFIGGNLHSTTAQFFLDMNNWNLAQAIGAYYDLISDNPPSTLSSGGDNPNNLYEINSIISSIQQNPSWAEEESTTTRPSYSMQLINELNSYNEVLIPPNTLINQRWRLLNNGNEPWPIGTNLRYHSGTKNLADRNSYLLDFGFGNGNTNSEQQQRVEPNTYRDIGLEFKSPEEPGNYSMRWTLATPEGYYFGDEIWIIIQVGYDTTTDITTSFNCLSTME